MAWIKLTDLLNHPVQLSVEQMVRVRLPTADFDTAAKCVVDLSNGQAQAVKETPDQVMQLLQK